MLSAKESDDSGSSFPQAWDAVETYFECISSCDINDGICISKCIEILKESKT